MRTVHDLGQLSWNLSPFVPWLWQFQPFARLEECAEAQITRARVPGSVQQALLDAGLLPDWTIGQAARACEWVENRHWVYETALPDDWLAGTAPAPQPGPSSSAATPARPRVRLSCECLDYCGWVFVNGQQVGEFRGTHVPWQFDLTDALAATGNMLRIVFDLPPRWLGQFGHTSRMREWKVRFNYTWDWSPRLVQVGIAGPVALEITDGAEISALRCTTALEVRGPGHGSTGVLHARGVVPSAAGTVRATLSRDGTAVRSEEVPAARFGTVGIAWTGLTVEPWQPNGCGDHPLYDLAVELLDARGQVLDRAARRVGFRSVEWQPCEGSPAHADPWICVVNGRPTFLQGVNYPPVLPNWADVTRAHHRRLIALYAELGINLVRINACQYLESTAFYDLCDEHGIMVWQEMPLTSSGVENTPPDDAASIDAVCGIARSSVARRGHHASLVLWGGGNEQVDRDLRPYDTHHPMLAALERVFRDEDPGRRFIPTSPSGPRFGMDEQKAERARELHWDVHGPWKPRAGMDGWKAFWAEADALFYSEVGSPSAAPAALIRKHAGGLPLFPISARNPLWCLTLSWWVENAQFEAEKGRPPAALEDYVAWSQARQAEALVIAVRAAKSRFPRCGGSLLWCGHDCFPCAVNTSIIDVEGRPKPAALALSVVWKEPVQ
jgi:beta-mannosidase